MTRLKPIQEKAALLLAEGWKQVQVAREVGVNAVTVSRWIKNADFAARIDELRQDLTSQSIVLLRDSVLKNTEKILEIAQYGGESGIVSSQLKAALWAVEKGLGRPRDPVARTRRAEKTVEAELLRQPEEELKELLERG